MYEGFSTFQQTPIQWCASSDKIRINLKLKVSDSVAQQIFPLRF